MQHPITRQDIRRVEVIVPAVEGSDPAPSLGDDEEAGGGVPGFEVFLVEAVQAAAGDVAQVQGGGTAPARPWTIPSRRPRRARVSGTRSLMS